MSTKQILKSKNIICSVPDQRKARAEQQVVKGEVADKKPASILQTHPHTWLFLDEGSASLLKKHS